MLDYSASPPIKLHGSRNIQKLLSFQGKLWYSGLVESLDSSSIVIYPWQDSMGIPKTAFRFSKQIMFSPHRIEHKYSPDSSHLLVYMIKDYHHDFYPGLDWLMAEKVGEFSYAIFGKGMEKVAEGKLTLPKVEGRDNVVKQIGLGDDGQLLVLTEMTNPSAAANTMTQMYKLRLYIYDKELTYYTIPYQDKFLSNVNFVALSGKQVYLSGFWSEKSHDLRRGLFTVKIDLKSNTITQKTIEAFPQDCIDKMISKDGTHKVATEFEYHDIYDIIQAKDGGSIFVAESQNFADKAYQFGKILVFKVDKMGKLLWTRSIDKYVEAKGIEAMLLPYRLVYDKDTDILFLLTNVKLGKKGFANLYQIASDGEAKVVATYPHALYGQIVPGISGKMNWNLLLPCFANKMKGMTVFKAKLQ